MTYDDYHAWFGDGRYRERVAGVAIVSVAPTILLRVLVGSLDRIPFAFATRTERMVLIETTDAVFEVLSDESVTRDRQDNRRESEAVGVPECRIGRGRPGHQSVDFLRPGLDGVSGDGPPEEDGRYHSSVLPGFGVNSGWLRRGPSPRVNDLLAPMNH